MNTKSLQLQIMKTIKKTTQVSIKLSALVAAVIFVFSLTGFISELDSKPISALMPGVVFEIEVKDHEQSPPRLETMEAAVEGKNLKMEILPGDGQGKGEMIFRGDRGKHGEVYLVDDDKQEYYVMDDSFVDNMMERVDQSKNMMNEALKGLSKEQRDMINEMKKREGAKIPDFNMSVPARKLVSTGIRATKAGYPCVKYEEYLDGVKIREIWITDWSNIDGGDEAENAFRGMNNFFDKITDKMGDMFGGNDFQDVTYFKNGFPVYSKSFNEESGELEDESWLKRTRRQRIDPDAFEPPSGYKRRSMLGG